MKQRDERQAYGQGSDEGSVDEFSEYLASLRSELGLSGGRAEEVCREVRCHLRERTEELVQAGGKRKEATQMAMRDFGDPKDLARRLTKANHSHRQVTPARVALALCLILLALPLGHRPVDGTPWLGLLKPVGSWAYSLGELPYDLLRLLTAIILAAPVALLAGVIVGRRWWWVAGLPVAAWALLMLLLVPRGYSTVPWAVLLLAYAPLYASFSLAGARLANRAFPRMVATAAGGAWLALLYGSIITAFAHTEMDVLSAIAFAEFPIAASATVWLLASKEPNRRRPGIVGTALMALSILVFLRFGFGGLDDVQGLWTMRLIVVMLAAASLIGGILLSPWRRIRDRRPRQPSLSG